MESLQPKSRKIKKPTKKEILANSNFVCGKCYRDYKSYSALYLHIKRKHDGITPPNTKIFRPARPTLHISVRPGRPTKVKFSTVHVIIVKTEKDIDNVNDKDVTLEVIQNELMSFLGEKLMVISDYSPKGSLEAVVTKLEEIAKKKKNQDGFLLSFMAEGKMILEEHKKKGPKSLHLDIDEDFSGLNKDNGIRVITWFLLWLAQVFVKDDFIYELYVVFSKIWKVLEQTQLEIQDLDNKLVWKKVVKECEEVIPDHSALRKNSNFLYEFISKVCHLIGNVFEDQEPESNKLNNHK